MPGRPRTDFASPLPMVNCPHVLPGGLRPAFRVPEFVLYQIAYTFPPAANTNEFTSVESVVSEMFSSGPQDVPS
jgi:hypothetical protein